MPETTSMFWPPASGLSPEAPEFILRPEGLGPIWPLREDPHLDVFRCESMPASVPDAEGTDRVEAALALAQLFDNAGLTLEQRTALVRLEGLFSDVTSIESVPKANVRDLAVEFSTSYAQVIKWHSTALNEMRSAAARGNSIFDNEVDRVAAAQREETPEEKDRFREAIVQNYERLHQGDEERIGALDKVIRKVTRQVASNSQHSHRMMVQELLLGFFADFSSSSDWDSETTEQRAVNWLKLKRRSLSAAAAEYSPSGSA